MPTHCSGHVVRVIVALVIVLALVVGCEAAGPTTIPASTAGQPAATVPPAATVVPPTATAIPPTATATALPALSGSGGGVIAFNSERDGNPEIYVMNADGSDQRRLTHDRADDFHPAWSPDGKTIAFYSTRDGNAEIYVMSADGSDQRRLTHNDAEDYYATWSPDGAYLVFGSDRDGNHEIYVMDANGDNPRRLTNTPAGEFFPAWSPDGTQIAFVSERDGNQEIYVMDADGSNPRRLTNTPGNELEPDWSPDGTRIAFVSNRNGDRLEVYVMAVPDGTDADHAAPGGRGSNPVQLTTNRSSDNDHSPGWSPDGTKIVFASLRDIYVMAVPDGADANHAAPGGRGSDRQQLTRDYAHDYFCTWRP